ncbi:MAG: hypothetical protein ABSC55_14560 [Syntrophorhabdales bacterium]|jgi:hypothetical protein
MASLRKRGKVYYEQYYVGGKKKLVPSLLSKEIVSKNVEILL